MASTSDARRRRRYARPASTRATWPAVTSPGKPSAARSSFSNRLAEPARDPRPRALQRFAADIEAEMTAGLDRAVDLGRRGADQAPHGKELHGRCDVVAFGSQQEQGMTHVAQIGRASC